MCSIFKLVFCRFNYKQERIHGLIQFADANKLHALRYLLIQLLLQVLLRPREYSEAASELIICCKKAFSAVDLPGSSGEDDLEVDDAPQVMDVLVDTLLSLLPQSSAPMRSSIEQVRMNILMLIFCSLHNCMSSRLKYHNVLPQSIAACPYVAS